MYWRILLLLALVLLSGCNGTVSSSSWMNETSVELEANPRCPGIGNPVTLRATLTNHGKQTEVVQLTDKPILDIAVRVDGGKTARWSDSHPLTPDQTHMELKPGESRSIEMQLVPGDLSPTGAPAFALAWAEYYYGNGPLERIGPGITLGIGQCH